MTPFITFLLKGAPTMSALAGLAFLILGVIDRRGDQLIAGSILFAAAIIAVQLAYPTNQSS